MLACREAPADIVTAQFELAINLQVAKCQSGIMPAGLVRGRQAIELLFAALHESASVHWHHPKY